MPQLTNPFIYGGPVSAEQFIGRSSEVNLILDQLSSHARGSVAVIGERRIGKTSLLHYISAPDVIQRWNLDEDASLFIFQDCGAVAPFTATRFWKTIFKRLRRLLKRKKAAPELLEAVQDILDADEVETLDIEFFLDDLNDCGFILVLMLDEFEWVVRTDPENEAATRDFLGSLRSLINHIPRALSLIVATRQPLDRVCRDIRFMGSPFYNNFVFVRLRPFSQEEAESLFEQMLADSEFSFSRAEKEAIYDMSGTHPLLLQAAAASIFEAKLVTSAPSAVRSLSAVEGAESGRELEAETLAGLRKGFSELVKHQFEDFWKWSRPREQQILTQLASGNEEALTLIEAWSNERETLLRRGLIVKNEDDDAYQIFSSVFWQWLIVNLYRLAEIHPPDNPQTNDLKQQLRSHHRRLMLLEQQKAKFGALHAPTHLLTDIEDTQDRIEALQVEIAALAE